MPPLLALPFPAIDPVAGGDRPRSRSSGTPCPISQASSAAGSMPAGWWRRTGSGVSCGRPSLNDIDDLIVWVALGRRPRRPHRLRPVLQFAALSRRSPRDPGDPQRRHVVPRRLSRCGAGDGAVRPIAKTVALYPSRSRRRRRSHRSVLRPHRQFREWRIVGADRAGFCLRGRVSLRRPAGAASQPALRGGYGRRPPLRGDGVGRPSLRFP